VAITAQYATATADSGGDAVFMFPEVPQGELWCGTTTVPGAPNTMTAMVLTGGSLVGSMTGPGSYGPWIADYSRRLSIVAEGLTPNAQFQAVWHADDKGGAFSTYPAPITPVVAGTVTVPIPLDVAIVSPSPVGVDGTVNVGNFPASQTVNGTVTAAPELAASATGGAFTMTGGTDTLPNHAATQGVTLSAPVANGHPIAIGGGFVLDPGHVTPLLPISNSDLITAVGTSPDVLSFLVT